MFYTIIKNNLRKNKLTSISLWVFVTLSTMLSILTIYLFGSLYFSTKELMELARAPDMTQMHAGEIKEEDIRAFAEAQPQVLEWQICNFLNIENAMIELNGISMSDSTQDNGICIANEAFDCFVDADSQSIIRSVDAGKIYIPVTYQKKYQLKNGDQVSICGRKFYIEGFLRDSQMNSMMASSKRFLVNEQDYRDLVQQGTEEYLIEFRLAGADQTGEVVDDYMHAHLPANGPTVTASLVRMMNVLSDGIMIFILLVVAVCMSAFAMICNRFIVLTCIEKESMDIGLLKAIGINAKDIRKLYFSKYVFLAVAGVVVGSISALALKNPFAMQAHRLYGMASNDSLCFVMAIIFGVMMALLQLHSVWRSLKKIEEISAIKCLQGIHEEKKRGTKKQCVFIACACLMSLLLMLVPQNMYGESISTRISHTGGTGISTKMEGGA